MMIKTTPKYVIT